MSEQVFMYDGQDPELLQASESARQSFKYFWRELSWERRRIVPALDLAMVKLPFTDGPARMTIRSANRCGLVKLISTGKPFPAC